MRATAVVITAAVMAEQRESRIEEGHLMSDHLHMMISIPSRALSGSQIESPGFARDGLRY